MAVREAAQSLTPERTGEPASDESDPLVSVVVPCYNYADFVCRAVDSVLGQSYRRVECIVVDDGSTDDTCERLRKYGSRIRYVRQENRGPSSARNTGIREAKGEWIALLDADDVWHPDKLAVQVRAARAQPDVALLGIIGTTSAMPDTLPPSAPLTPIGIVDLLTGTPFGPSSVIIKRSALEATGLFDEDLPSAEDRDMWLRLAARFPVARVDCVAWHYALHASQISRNRPVTSASLARVLRKFHAGHPTSLRLRAMGWSYYHVHAARAFADPPVERGRAVAHVLTSLPCYPWHLSGRPRNRVRLLANLLLSARLKRRLRFALPR
jgi:glycosyltransferase involved in cell wall biosynthesis